MRGGISSHRSQCGCVACRRRLGLVKVPVNVRLPSELVEWLRQQPEGITGWIEQAARRTMRRQRR